MKQYTAARKAAAKRNKQGALYERAGLVDRRRTTQEEDAAYQDIPIIMPGEAEEADHCALVLQWSNSGFGHPPVIEMAEMVTIIQDWRITQKKQATRVKDLVKASPGWETNSIRYKQRLAKTRRALALRLAEPDRVKEEATSSTDVAPDPDPEEAAEEAEADDDEAKLALTDPTAAAAMTAARRAAKTAAAKSPAAMPEKTIDELKEDLRKIGPLLEQAELTYRRITAAKLYEADLNEVFDELKELHDDIWLTRAVRTPPKKPEGVLEPSGTRRMPEKRCTAVPRNGRCKQMVKEGEYCGQHFEEICGMAIVASIINKIRISGKRLAEHAGIQAMTALPVDATAGWYGGFGLRVPMAGTPERIKGVEVMKFPKIDVFILETLTEDGHDHLMDASPSTSPAFRLSNCASGTGYHCNAVFHAQYIKSAYLLITRQVYPGQELLVDYKHEQYEKCAKGGTIPDGVAGILKAKQPPGLKDQERYPEAEKRAAMVDYIVQLNADALQLAIRYVNETEDKEKRTTQAARRITAAKHASVGTARSDATARRRPTISIADGSVVNRSPSAERERERLVEAVNAILARMTTEGDNGVLREQLTAADKELAEFDGSPTDEMEETVVTAMPSANRTADLNWWELQTVRGAPPCTRLKNGKIDVPRLGTLVWPGGEKYNSNSKKDTAVKRIKKERIAVFKQREADGTLSDEEEEEVVDATVEATAGASAAAGTASASALGRTTRKRSRTTSKSVGVSGSDNESPLGSQSTGATRGRGRRGKIVRTYSAAETARDAGDITPAQCMMLEATYAMALEELNRTQTAALLEMRDANSRRQAGGAASTVSGGENKGKEATTGKQ